MLRLLCFHKTGSAKSTQDSWYNEFSPTVTTDTYLKAAINNRSFMPFSSASSRTIGRVLNSSSIVDLVSGVTGFAILSWRTTKKRRANQKVGYKSKQIKFMGFCYNRFQIKCHKKVSSISFTKTIYKIGISFLNEFRYWYVDRHYEVLNFPSRYGSFLQLCSSLQHISKLPAKKRIKENSFRPLHRKKTFQGKLHKTRPN